MKDRKEKQMNWDDIFLLPTVDSGGITKPFIEGEHRGVDIGWADDKNTPIMCPQDGIVVDRGFGSEVGNYIVLKHTYSSGNGSIRFTGFIHLKDYPNVALGQKFEMGDKMGNARMGNTGYSNYEHLHLYLTKKLALNTKYTWDTMRLNAIDPVPYLYWDKAFNTGWIASDWKKEYPNKLVYPKPVERDENKHQVYINSDTRRLRAEPSLNGKIYDELCTKGIYNVYDWVENTNNWALIDTIDGNKFWAAIMDGEDLPMLDYRNLYEKEKARAEKLEAENLKLEDELDQISKSMIETNKKLEMIKSDTERWAL